MLLRSLLRRFKFFTAVSLACAFHTSGILGHDIQEGDYVVTISRAPVKAGKETLTRVKQWSALQAREVQGEWVHVVVDKGQNQVKGWIHAPQLVRSPDEIDWNSHRRGAGLGLVGTPDARGPAAALTHPDVNVRAEAARVLDGMRAAAEPAVPLLIRALRDDSSTVQFCAASALGHVGAPAKDAVPALMQACHDSSLAVRQAAITALDRMGPEAEPALLEALQDEQMRLYAAHLLRGGGAATVAEMFRLRQSEDGQMRAIAEKLLTRLGPGAIPALTGLLEVENAETRSWAALALGHIGGQAAEALASALENDRLEVRILAVDALIKIGKEAAPAAPALIKTLEAEDRRLRALATDALAAIGEGAAEAVPALTQTLDDQELRWRAAEALGAIGAASVPVLLEKLSTAELNQREAVVYALGKAAGQIAQRVDETRGMEDLHPGGDEAEGSLLLDLVEGLVAAGKISRAVGDSATHLFEARNQLVTALNDEHETVRVLAADALSRLGSVGVSPLLQCFEDAESERRALVAFALGRMGPKAKMAVPALKASLGEVVGETRLNVGQALWQIEQHAWGIPVLTQTLKYKPDANVRVASAEALGRIGTQAKRAVPDLAKSLSDESPLVRAAAATALAEIGKEAKPAVSELAEALEDEDLSVCAAAAFALGQIGPDAKAAVTALEESLQRFPGEARLNAGWALWRISKHRWTPNVLGQTLEYKQDPNVRLASAVQLGQLGQHAETSMPLLKKAFHAETEPVRDAAAMAIAQITAETKKSDPILLEAVHTTNGTIRLNALWALWETDQDLNLISEFIDALSDPDPQVRAQAAGALSRIGAPAAAAVPALCLAVDDDDSYVRAMAAAALGQIGEDAKQAVPILTEMLLDPNSTVRYQAGAALSALEEELGESALPIMKVLEQQSRKAKEQAAQAYTGLDPNNRPDVTVNQMAAALDASEAEHRRTAALLLAAWDKPVSSALDNLSRAGLRERDHDTFWCVIWAQEAKGVEVDQRLKRALDERKIKYSINDYGNFRASFNVAGGRSQVAWIFSDTSRYRDFEIREVESIGFKFKKELRADIANRLLDYNRTIKLGAWEIQGDLAVFVAKIAADADGQSLWDTLVIVTDVADEIEKEITGADRY